MCMVPLGYSAKLAFFWHELWERRRRMAVRNFSVGPRPLTWKRKGKACPEWQGRREVARNSHLYSILITGKEDKRSECGTFEKWRFIVISTSKRPSKAILLTVQVCCWKWGLVKELKLSSSLYCHPAVNVRGYKECHWSLDLRYHFGRIAERGVEYGKMIDIILLTEK